MGKYLDAVLAEQGQPAIDCGKIPAALLRFDDIPPEVGAVPLHTQLAKQREAFFDIRVFIRSVQEPDRVQAQPRIGIERPVGRRLSGDISLNPRPKPTP